MRVEKWSSPGACQFYVWLLSAALVGYGLTRPHVLFGVGGYDDGVYFGVAVRLLHGQLPYRDFTYLHPPGLTLLLSPVAALSYAVGTDTAFGIARVVCGCFGTAVPVLAASLVRARGSRAVLLVGVCTACFPLGIAAYGTLTLEPFFLAVSLLGATVLFRAEGPLTPRRALIGGMALGLGCSIKIWGVFILLAAIAAVCVRARERLLTVTGGAIGVVAVICSPFLVAAPRAFVHDVIVTQVVRGTTVQAASLAQRVLDMTGLSVFPSSAKNADVLSVLAALVAGGVAVTLVIDRRRTVAAEWFIGGSWLLAIAAMLSAGEFFSYYAYFPGIFGYASLALVLDRAIAGVTSTVSTRRGREFTSQAVRWVTAPLPAVGIGLILLPSTLRFLRSYQSGYSDVLATFSQAAIPEGACVLFDTPSLALTAGVFSPTAPDCPAVVDSYGSWLAFDPAHPPNTVPVQPAFAATWQAWFARGDYVLERAENSDYLPWNAPLEGWFSSHYALIAGAPGIYIYKNLDVADPSAS